MEVGRTARVKGPTSLKSGPFIPTNALVARHLPSPLSLGEVGWSQGDEDKRGGADFHGRKCGYNATPTLWVSTKGVGIKASGTRASHKPHHVFPPVTGGEAVPAGAPLVVSVLPLWSTPSQLSHCGRPTCLPTHPIHVSVAHSESARFPPDLVKKGEGYSFLTKRKPLEVSPEGEEGEGGDGVGGGGEGGRRRFVQFSTLSPPPPIGRGVSGRRPQSRQPTAARGNHITPP